VNPYGCGRVRSRKWTPHKAFRRVFVYIIGVHFLIIHPLMRLHSAEQRTPAPGDFTVFLANLAETMAQRHRDPG
jgi:hypothetical protein